MPRTKQRADRRSEGAILFEAWRKQGKLTQFDVAVRLGIDPSPISAMERGKRRPGRKWAVLIEERTKGAVPVGAWERYPGRQ